MLMKRTAVSPVMTVSNHCVVIMHTICCSLAQIMLYSFAQLQYCSEAVLCYGALFACCCSAQSAEANAVRALLSINGPSDLRWMATQLLVTCKT